MLDRRSKKMMELRRLRTMADRLRDDMERNASKMLITQIRDQLDTIIRIEQGGK